MKDGNKIDLYSDGDKERSRNEAFSILEEIHVKERKLLYEQAGNGLISYEELGRQIDLMMKDNDYLAMHQYTIWYNDKTEYWYTYLPDSAGRRQIKSGKKSELIRRIIAYYKENESKRFFKKDSLFCNTLLEDMNDTIVEDFIRETIADFHLTRKAYSDFQIVLKGGFLYAKKVEKCTTYSIASFLIELNLSDNYNEEPSESRQKIYEHLSRNYPFASGEQLNRLLK
ncbi:MAG: hypothetical protein LIO99_06865 [Clostridiales bacterium]|nr:hypothetical protein [Clostridiales bacterium]